MFLKVSAGNLRGTGTGFVIDVKENAVLVATNAHVVEPERGEGPGRPNSAPSQITAVFRSGGGRGREQSLPARVVALDGEGNQDLAVLEVLGVQQPPAPIGVDDSPPIGLTTPVLIFGFPFGNLDARLDPTVQTNPSLTVNRGSVSSLRKSQSGSVSRLQIDGSINPGNSGGPVVDESGRLVGVAVAKIDNTNIGFALPAAELSRLMSGRPGALRMTLGERQQDAFRLSVEATLFDPRGRIQSASLLYTNARVDPVAGEDGQWAALPNPGKVPLRIEGKTASTSFWYGPGGIPMPAPAPVPFGAGGPGFGPPGLTNRPSGLGEQSGTLLMVQVACRLVDGQTVLSRPARYLLGDRPGPLVPRGEGTKPRVLPTRFELLSELVDGLKRPAKDCATRRDEGSFLVDVPAGIRLLSPDLGVKSSPLALADVSGDFVAVTKVSGDLTPGDRPPRYKGKDTLPGTYQGAGLIVWQDSKNYVRLERSSRGVRNRPTASTETLIEIVKEGRLLGYDYLAVNTGPLYLRAERRDRAMKFAFSRDGEVWIAYNRLTVAFPDKIQVGLVASNLSSQPLTARFEAFELTRDKVQP